QIGFAVPGASFTKITADGSSHAFVGNADIGQDAVGSVNDLIVTADANLDLHGHVDAIAGALFGIIANFAFVDAINDVDASIRTGAAVNTINHVTVNALSEAEVDADLFALTIGGGTVGLSWPRAKIEPDVNSYIGMNTTVGTSFGDISVGSYHNYMTNGSPINKFADAHADSPSFAIATGNGAIPKAFASPRVESLVHSQAVLSAGGDVNTVARANNLARSNANAITGAIGGYGTSIVNGEANGSIRAHIDGTINKADNVNVAARSYNDVESDAEASSFLILGGSGAFANSETKADTRAYINTGALVNASQNVTVDAESDSFTDSYSYGLTIGIALAIGIVFADADTDTNTTAFVGGTVNALGSVAITADANSNSEADTWAASGGVLAGVGTRATANTDPSVAAFVADNSTVIARQDISVSGLTSADADAYAKGFGGGVIQVGISDANADATPTLDAYVGNGASVTAGRNINVTGLHNYTTGGSVILKGAQAEAVASSGQLIGGNGADAEANANASIDAYLNTSVTANAGGNVNITTRSFQDATAKSDGNTYGGLVAGIIDATATALGTVRSFVNDNSDVNTGSLNVLAVGNYQADADTDASVGGVISIKGTEAIADARPNVQAFLDTQTDVVAAGNVDIKAVALGWANGESRGNGIGVIDVGSSDAVAIWMPTVNSFIAGGVDIDAGNDVNIQGFVNHNEAGSFEASKITIATAKSSSGALIGINGSTATTTAVTNTKAFTGLDSIIEAGRDVLIRTKSGSVIDGSANGKAFALIAGGKTKSTSTLTNRSHVTVGRLAEVHSGRDVKLSSNSDLRLLNQKTTSGQGGLIAISGATAQTTINNETFTLIDTNSLVCAFRHVTGEALTSMDIDVETEANAAALISGNETEARATIVSVTKVEVASNALVHGITGNVNLYAKVIRLRAQVETFSQTYALGSLSKANSYLDTISVAKVFVRPGADVYAGQAIDIVSRHDNVDTDSIAVARIVGVTGIVKTHAHNNLILKSDICIDAGATLNAPNVSLTAFSPTTSGTYGRESDATGDTIVNYIVETIETVKSVLSNIPLLGWILKEILCIVTTIIEVILFSNEEATVGGIFSSTNTVTMNGTINQSSNHQTVCNQSPQSDDPIVVIGTDGRVVNARNIQADVQNGRVTISPIQNAAMGHVSIVAPNGLIEGDGDINLRNRFSNVTIVNESAFDLLIGDILMQSDITGPQLSLIAGHNESDLAIVGGDTPVVSISSTNGGRIVFQGDVNNPAGVTVVSNTTGEIIGTPDAYIESSSIQIDSPAGSVGAVGNPLQLRPVSADGATGVVVDAEDVFVDITAVEYQLPADGQRPELTGSVRVESITARGELQVDLGEGIAVLPTAEGDIVTFVEVASAGNYDVGAIDSVNAAGAVTISDGGVLVASENVTSPIVVNSGGTTSTGEDDNRIQTGDLSYDAGGIFAANLSGDRHEPLLVNGRVDVTEAELLLHVHDQVDLTPGQEILLLDNDSDDPVVGEFANLPEGTTFEVAPLNPDLQSNRVFQITYAGGDGNDISLRYRADAGGPYVISEGDSLTLQAAADLRPGQDAVKYEWDIDGDGSFAEGVVGSSLTLTWDELIALGADDGPRASQITARAFNDVDSVKATAAFTIENVAPAAAIDAPTQQLLGLPFDLTLFAQNEPSPADLKAGLVYEVDFGDGQTETLTLSEESLTLEHNYGQSGTYTIALTVSDKDGGTTTATHDIFVNRVIIVDGDLVVGGSLGRDRIVVSSAGGDTVLVRVNDERYGPFSEPVGGKLVIVGGDSGDLLSVAGNVTMPVVLRGGGGRDQMAGGSGDNSLYGDDGNDTILTGEGNNFVDAGAGNDNVSGRSGIDRVFGGEGKDIISLGGGNDFADGGPGNDRILGGGGDDFLFGGAGNDTLLGGYDNDVVLGGDGNDTVRGERGEDLLVGGTGNDAVRGDQGVDTLIGSAAAIEQDTAQFDALLSAWTLTRDDSLLGVITNDGDPDLLNGGGGVDHILLAGEDSFIARGIDDIVRV
ncbi:MAG: Ca2+-binding RTX toxin-like protein, partial [Pirellulaceae bacterium]